MSGVSLHGGLAHRKASTDTREQKNTYIQELNQHPS